MFPVISMMRRCAANIIYITAVMTENRNGSRVMLADQQVVPALSAKGKWAWGRKLDEVTLFTASAKAGSPQEAAAKLVSYENEVADQLGLLEGIYTLIVAREEEEDEGRTRRVHFGLVRGVVRMNAFRVTRSSGTRRRVDFRKADSGAVRM